MPRPVRKPRSKSPARPKTVRRRGGAPARLAPDNAGERLQKVLAAAGVASRRECEQLIIEGRVEVDGKTVLELGTRVDRDTQQIKVDGEALTSPKLVYFAVHKPAGVVCTSKDPSGRTRVTDLLPPETGRVFNVGRLDLESEGLILVTNDGALANELTHPKHGVEKTYEVQVMGVPDSSVLAQVRKGMHLAEGYAKAVKVKIKSRRKSGAILEMVLDEGRNREVRRMLAKVGHKVQRLTRIAVGPIRLGEMPRGAVRLLTPEEIKKLRTYIRSNPERQKAREERVVSKPTSRQVALEGRERKRKAAGGKAGANAKGKRGPGNGKSGYSTTKRSTTKRNTTKRGTNNKNRGGQR